MTFNRWKHPRVCGEDFEAAIQRSQKTETPPRMRGRPPDDGVGAETLGNTPAYAGKTFLSVEMENKLKKHPRVCGEDSR